MAFSPNLGIDLIATGSGSGTWGATTNTNLGTIIEQAIAGYATYACTGGTDIITLPDGGGTPRVAGNMYLELTGTGGGTLEVPTNQKLYFVYNNTASGAVTVKVNGQTGVSVAHGDKVLLVCDGTDIFYAVNYVPLTSISATNITATNITSTNVTATNDVLVSGATLKFANFNISNSGTSLAFSSVATYTGSISSTTMTVTSVATGNVLYGQAITGTGVTAGTTTAAQLTSTETAAASPTASSGGAVGETSFVVSSASNIAVGQMVDGLGVPVSTYVGSISDTTIFLVNRTGGAVAFTTQAAGTYNFRTAAAKGTYTVSASQTVSSTTITGTKTVAQITNTGLVTSLA